MPCEVFLVLGQHFVHLVDAIGIVDVCCAVSGVGIGSRGRELAFVGFGGSAAGAGGRGRVVGGIESGVGVGDEVGISDDEVAGKGVGELSKHVAGGHYFVVDLQVVSILIRFL